MEDSKKDLMTNVIWFELLHTQFWELYLCDYSGYSKSIIKYFNFFILAISAFGAALPGVFNYIHVDTNYTGIIYFIVFCLMMLTQIMTLMQKEILPNENNYLDMVKLVNMYLDYLNDVENLWIELTTNGISGSEAEQKYYELRKKVQPIEELKCLSMIKPKKKIKHRVEHDAYVRLHRRFGSEIPKEEEHNKTFITKIWNRIFN